MIIPALAAAERRLLALPVLEAFIARRESGDTRADDAVTVEAVAHELLDHQSEDGSWGGNVALTAEALLLLADLQVAGQFMASVEAAEAWLRSRRNQPGRFTDGCSPARHDRELCEHFAGGFFSPGPPAHDFSGARLASGLSFTTDVEARLGISALALTAIRRWSRASTDDVIHMNALVSIAHAALRPQALAIGLPAMTLVLAALTMAPRNAQIMTVLHGALTRLAGVQRADGSWPGAEPFHVADVYLLAVANGYGSPLFDAALIRTANTLALTQQADGSWGQDAGPYRLLSGWRTLRYVAGMKKGRE